MIGPMLMLIDALTRRQMVAEDDVRIARTPAEMLEDAGRTQQRRINNARNFECFVVCWKRNSTGVSTKVLVMRC